MIGVVFVPMYILYQHVYCVHFGRIFIIGQTVEIMMTRIEYQLVLCHQNMQYMIESDHFQMGDYQDTHANRLIVFRVKKANIRSCSLQMDYYIDICSLTRYSK